MSVKRFDAGSMGEIKRTPQGGLIIPSRPTRTGVLTYRNADGTTRRELRPPEEVFSPESLATLRNAPITDLHPANPVNPDNWQALTVGHVGEDVTRDGSHVAAPLLIQHAGMIDKINKGERKELSCGYECDLDSTPGTLAGEDYDAIQRNIKYNHVAIGGEGWGRAGASVSLRLDSGDAAEVDSDKSVCNREGDNMATMIRVDGIEYEAGSAAHLQAVAKQDAAKDAEIAKLRADNTAHVSVVAQERARADKAEKDAKAEKERADKALDPKGLVEVIRRRVDTLDMLRRVAKITGSRFDAADEEAAEGENEGDMMLRIVKMIDPDFNGAGMSPDKVHGYAMGRVAALLQGADDNDEEGQETVDTETPGGDREQEVSGGVVPPAAPGRSDRRDGGGTGRGFFGGVFSARRVTTREDGRGESVIRADGGRRSPREDANTPEAAERRMLKDSREGYTQPLAYSKDPPAAK